jgi:hypothetical protein
MKFVFKQWHKDLLIVCFVVRILYVFLTLTQFSLVIIKFNNPVIVKWVAYFGAFFDAIFNSIIFVLTAYIFRPFNKKPVVVDGMPINKEVHMLLFTFAILNIITIFASSITVYLKQIPGFDVLSNTFASNGIVDAATTATQHKITSSTESTDESKPNSSASSSESSIDSSGDSSSA